MSLVLGNFFMTYNLSSKVVGRLTDIYPGEQIRTFVVACNMLWVFGFFWILYHCCKVSRTSDLSRIHLFQKKRFIPLALIMPVLFLLPLAKMPRGILPYAGSLTSPSSYYISDVASQAIVVFQHKERYGTPGHPGVHVSLLESRREHGFNSTGQILAVAVIATEVFKDKKSSKDPEKKRDAGLILIERILSWETSYQKDRKRFFMGFSPLHLINPSHLTEIGLISLIEENIENNRREATGLKLRELLGQIEKKQKRSPASTTRIASIKKDLNRLFPKN